MLEKTQGIVLNYLKYRDTSVIVRIYTEKYGLQSYIINGIRSIKSKKSIGLLQPFTILDLVIYHSDKRDLHRLSEYKNHFPLKTLHYDIRKSTIALFLTEILIKTLEEHFEEENSQFLFIKNAIIQFDALEAGYENFHIFFLINYANYLGFGIYDTTTIDSQGDSELVDFLQLVKNENQYFQLKTTQSIRRKALDMILAYYSEHIDNFGKIKSLQVLYQIFD
ncbi:MAG: DNA repair protein RecO [Cyclobacteriaceae bacterium]